MIVMSDCIPGITLCLFAECLAESYIMFCSMGICKDVPISIKSQQYLNISQIATLANNIVPCCLSQPDPLRLCEFPEMRKIHLRIGWLVLAFK